MEEDLRCAWRVHSCSSEGEVHEASNVLKDELFRVWQTREPAEDAWLVLEAQPPVGFCEMEIVNAGAALVEVFGLREDAPQGAAGDHYEMLLSAQQLMSAKDVISKSNCNRAFLYSLSNSKLARIAAQHRWKRIRVSCRQPFGLDEQKTCIGISRIKFKPCKTEKEVAAEVAEARLQENMKSELTMMFPKVSAYFEPQAFSQVTKAMSSMTGFDDHDIKDNSVNRGKRQLPSWSSPSKDNKQLKTIVNTVGDKSDNETSGEIRSVSSMTDQSIQRRGGNGFRRRHGEEHDKDVVHKSKQSGQPDDSHGYSLTGSKEVNNSRDYHTDSVVNAATGSAHKGANTVVKDRDNGLAPLHQAGNAEAYTSTTQNSTRKQKNSSKSTTLWSPSIPVCSQQKEKPPCKGQRGSKNLESCSTSENSKGKESNRNQWSSSLPVRPSAQACVAGNSENLPNSPVLVSTEEDIKNKQKSKTSRGKKVQQDFVEVTEVISPDNFSKFLDGVYFAISGLVNPERADVRDKALEMGAQYRPDWNADCTLLVCAFANTPKFNQVKGENGTIVAKDWILDCHRQRKLIEIDKYLMHPGKPWRQSGVSVSNVQGTDKTYQMTLGSFSQIKEWVHRDVTACIGWLQQQENQPEAGELKMVAIQGIQLCLDDALECLQKHQSTKNILETWDFISRAVQELQRGEHKMTPKELVHEAERLKWIYADELNKLKGIEGHRTEVNEDEDDDDATELMSDEDHLNDPVDSESDGTEVLDENSIQEAQEIISKMLQI